jgi:hypothetical protein
MGNHQTIAVQSSPSGEGDVGTFVSSDPTDLSLLNEENAVLVNGTNKLVTKEWLQGDGRAAKNSGRKPGGSHGGSVEFAIVGEYMAVFYLIPLWLFLGDEHLQSSLTDENAPALFELADCLLLENLKATILRELNKRKVYEIKRVTIASKRRRVAAIVKRMGEKRHAEFQRMLAARVVEAERRATLAEQRAEVATRRSNASERSRLRWRRWFSTLKGRHQWSREPRDVHQNPIARLPVVQNRSHSRNYNRYRDNGYSDESDGESRLTDCSW